MNMVGYVDGIEVKFDFYPPNKFNAEIPKKLNGTYIIQLKVIDDAGNTNGYSDIFIKIDFTSLKIQILPESFNCIKNEEEFGYNELPLDYVKRINCAYDYAEIKQRYTFRELIM